jgi:hypothetical protein
VFAGEGIEFATQLQLAVAAACVLLRCVHQSWVDNICSVAATCVGSVRFMPSGNRENPVQSHAAASCRGCHANVSLLLLALAAASCCYLNCFGS